MNITTKTSIAVLTAFFAVSGVAQAESVKVSLTGKDAKTIHAEIVRAAHTVCRDVGFETIAVSAESECVADTVARADQQLRMSAESPVARAETTAAPHGDR